jgi:predicted GNAT superfamily acetyltransferase
MTALEIRECRTVSEFNSCVNLQREVFGLPDLEISPRRHLIVSRQAGGWTLGAFDHGVLIGFVHHMIGRKPDGEIFGYSHMMAVAAAYQNQGVGARLKWAQRERALAEGQQFIKWTWEPLRARNAHFNLNRLGVIVESYAENFYGTDYGANPPTGAAPGIDSDRLFAGWRIASERVARLARGESIDLPPEAGAIEIPSDWRALLQEDPAAARNELLRVRGQFQQAFAAGLVCAAFDRAPANPRYRLFDPARL